MLNLFNSRLVAARYWLEWATSGRVRRSQALRCALGEIERALSIANRMRDRKRAGLCLKILNWLRADLRRLAA